LPAHIRAQLFEYQDVGPTTSSISEVFQHASLLWRVGLDGTQSLYTGGRLTAQVQVAQSRGVRERS
jgi:outer membrane protein TolC